MFIQNFYKDIYFSFIKKAKNRNPIDGYTEIHHIIPKSLGGTDEPSNLVVLSASEHFKCHLLLCRFTTGKHRFKMLHASKMMAKMKREYQDRYVPKSRIYEWIKTNSALASSAMKKGKTYEELYGAEKAKEMRLRKSLPRGPQHPDTIRKRADKVRGQKRTVEQRETMKQSQLTRNSYVYSDKERAIISKKISEGNKGKKKTDQHKKNLSVSLKGKTKGIPKSEETKKNMRKPKSSEHSANIKSSALNRPRSPCPQCGKLLQAQHMPRHIRKHNN